VTDPHHALSGQQLRLVSLRSARGPAYVVVALSDGRHRSLRRSITDLAGAAAASPLTPVIPLRNGFRISARTLLPLARHIVAGLATPIEKVTRDDRSPPAAASAPRGPTCSATALAELAARDANADGSSSRRPAAADDAEIRRRGGRSC
jgi:hypothetical protein